MAYDKMTVLAHAAEQLNRIDQPWYVVVQGDSIIAQWKWMDAQWFAPAAVTNEVRTFTYTVTLKDGGKYKEHDTLEAKSSGFSVSPGGTVGFGISSSKFGGHATQKSFTFGAGRDKDTGQVGMVAVSFDTENVKKPIRAFLESAGWKKAGLFG